MRFGVSIEDLNDPLDRELLRALARELKLDHCFKFVDMSKLWPAEDRWFFDKLDDDVRAILDAGLDLGLRLLWCPPHAAQGKPTYLEYAQGSSAISDGTNCGALYCGHLAADHGNAGCIACAQDAGQLPVRVDHGFAPLPPGILRLAIERDYVRRPPHIDSGKMRLIGRTLGERYGPFVKWWSVLNEIDGDTYNPAIHGAFDQEGAFTRMANEVIVPLSEGLQAVRPFAVLNGPEASGGDGFRRMLEKTGDSYSYYTVHRYLRGGLDEFHDQMNFYAEMLRRWGVANTVDVRNSMWLTEAGDAGDGSRLVELSREVMARYGDVLHGISYYMTPQNASMFFNRQPDGRYVLHAQGRALRDFIARQRPPIIAAGPGRRRAVPA